MDVDWSTYGWLIGVVVVASACQNLTGFAFGLIFVGMAGALHLMPIADAANVAGLLSSVAALRPGEAAPFQVQRGNREAFAQAGGKWHG